MRKVFVPLLVIVLAIAPSGARAQAAKVAPVEFTRGDDELRIAVTDLSPRLLDFPAAVMRPAPLETLRAVAVVLQPDKLVYVHVIAYVGACDGNTFSYGQDGKPMVAVPLEMDERQRGAILPREMTHVMHIVTAGLSGGWERSIAATLMQEGLAIHVAREVVPDRDLTELIEYTPGWWA